MLTEKHNNRYSQANTTRALAQKQTDALMCLSGVE